MTDTIKFRAIGHIENEFQDPALPEEIAATRSRVIVNPSLTKGLQGLEPGSKITIVFYFDRSEGCELLQHPRGDTNRPKRGVFALCSPHRPNPIGITAVDLLAVDGNILTVRGLDAINGTPLLDIKPA